MNRYHVLLTGRVIIVSTGVALVVLMRYPPIDILNFFVGLVPTFIES